MVTRRSFNLWAAAFGLALSAHKAIAAHKEGKDEPAHVELATPQAVATPGKSEVIEFFWYGCPSCDKVEPSLEAWEKSLGPDVVLRREHVLWPERAGVMEIHARIFLTLRAMGLLGTQHRVVFDVIHRARFKFRDDDAAFDWAERRGIDRRKFEATYRSPAVAADLARANQLTRDYGIRAVPTFVINGKYMTTPHRAGGAPQMFALIEELIRQDRGAKKPGQ